MNGATLAYLGDAYFELKVRQHLIDKQMTNVNQLHQQAIRFTSGEAQAKMILHFLENDILTENEITFYKKGRNISGSGRKNMDQKTYHFATGFESLIGYLYLHDRVRCDAIIDSAIKWLEEQIIHGQNSR